MTSRKKRSVGINGKEAQMENENLKPCPFCGRKDTLHFDRYKSNDSWWGYIECTECIATGPVAKLKKDAVEAWNRRPVNADPR